MPTPENPATETVRTLPETCDVAIVGAGPAGLMAAEVLSAAGRQVHMFDAMPSVGRKFLLAGRGGLNLTHSEARPAFDQRYGAQQNWVADWLDGWDAAAVRAWADALGARTFVGSSGRVFPHEMKAAPLLRAWLQRLRHPAQGQPVHFHMRHRWQGWDGQDLLLAQPSGPRRVRTRATLLALGGASWPRLGSDGQWVPQLQALGVPVAPLRPANCGFDVWGREGLGWSEHLVQRHAGEPLKTVVLQPGHTGHARTLESQGRIRGDRLRDRGQPGLCRFGPAAGRFEPRTSLADAGPAA